MIGFDIERHDYGRGGYPGQLVLQDVLTLDGRQFRNAAVIVASPPCQEYSYMAMPWTRAKEKARLIRASQIEWARLTALFDACFRIAREAGVPIVVENVKGAQPWVGRAKWHYGSYYLWGDVPALMPSAKQFKSAGMDWSDRTGGSFQSAAVRSMDGIKVPGNDTFKKNGRPCNKLTDPAYGSNAEKGFAKEWRAAVKNGNDWFGSGENCSLQRRASSGSNARKAASAQIAKIPFALAQYIARVYKP